MIEKPLRLQLVSIASIVKTGWRCLLLVVFTLSLVNCIGAGKNSPVVPQQQGYFPHLQGIDLLGSARRVPQSFAGSLNLVVVAFKREQQVMINPWIEIADSIIVDNPQLRFYEIPLIYEINSIYRTWVNNGMRSGISDPIARERTITVYTDRKKFTTLMDMDVATIYILLLDNNGKILWREQGPASDVKTERLTYALQQAMLSSQ